MAPCGLAQGPQPNALPEVDGLLLSGGGAVPTACGLLGAGGLHTLGLPFLGATGRDRGLRASWRGDGGDRLGVSSYFCRVVHRSRIQGLAGRSYSMFNVRRGGGEAIPLVQGRSS